MATGRRRFTSLRSNRTVPAKRKKSKHLHTGGKKRRILTLPRPRLVYVLALLDEYERMGKDERKKKLPRFDGRLRDAVTDDMAVNSRAKAAPIPELAPVMRTAIRFYPFPFCTFLTVGRRQSPREADSRRQTSSTSSSALADHAMQLSQS